MRMRNKEVDKGMDLIMEQRAERGEALILCHLPCTN